MAKKILLAEDSVTMQKVFQLTFAAEDVSITAVPTCVEAIARAKEMKPDLVIADLSMPGKNGYDVCQEVKADPGLAGTPVLLLHGSASTFDEVRARNVSADGDIVKPFETQFVIDKVRSVLASARGERRDELATYREQPREVRGLGPVQSLSSPIESPSDVVIDTNEFGAPAPAQAAAVARPSAAPARPAQPRSPARPPSVSPPPRPIPAAARPPTRPAAPVARPSAPPPAPGPGLPRFPSAAPRPAPTSPRLTAVGTKPGRAEPLEVEITIEAEPPQGHELQEPLPSFDIEPTPIFESHKQPGLATAPTMIGVGAGILPPPPAGMPLPPAMAAPVSAPAQAIPAPVRSGEGYDPGTYEAIARLSRDIIEKIVWEVVPELAERIIREELDRLVESRRAK